LEDGSLVELQRPVRSEIDTSTSFKLTNLGYRAIVPEPCEEVINMDDVFVKDGMRKWIVVSDMVDGDSKTGKSANLEDLTRTESGREEIGVTRGPKGKGGPLGARSHQESAYF
jgi:hypothetical protein